MGQPYYLIDTNVVIDYLSGKLPPKATYFINAIVDEAPQISVITKIEILGFNTQKQQSYQTLVDFIDATIVFNLDNDIVDKTIELRKTYRIKLPDAIITATVLVNELILLTRNISDFKNIEALKIIDPWTL